VGQSALILSHSFCLEIFGSWILLLCDLQVQLSNGEVVCAGNSRSDASVDIGGEPSIICGA